tara:strand:+ start:1473 stop:2318 length:846 start_codon:yes stop_codon:yes gene_type:complete
MNKPLLIAEIGINHNGDLDLAKQLILIAKKTNFDCVKFQKRDTNEVYTKEYLDQSRESPWGNTQRHQKEGLEFGKKEYDEINQFCKNIKIDWFASAWDLKSLKFLEQYKLKYNKIASAMIVDKKFLEEVAKQKIYTFISTGMSTEKDIDIAVEIFRRNKCEFELMHCVSTYPTKVKDVNLLTINALKRKYNCKVGYSGHENGVAISIGAFSLGISSLERHITIDRTMYGSDQSASIEEKGMQNLTDSINKISDAMGVEKLGFVLEEELPIAKKLRAHIKSQ